MFWNILLLFNHFKYSANWKQISSQFYLFSPWLFSSLSSFQKCIRSLIPQATTIYSFYVNLPNAYALSYQFYDDNQHVIN